MRLAQRYLAEIIHSRRKILNNAKMRSKEKKQCHRCLHGRRGKRGLNEGLIWRRREKQTNKRPVITAATKKSRLENGKFLGSEICKSIFFSFLSPQMSCQVSKEKGQAFSVLYQRKLNRSPAEGSGTADTSGNWEMSGRLWMWERNSSRTWYTLASFSL